MFQRIRHFLKSFDPILYISISETKISVLQSVTHEYYEDEPVLSIHGSGKKARILAVGKDARETIQQESKLFTPCNPLLMEKENFELCSKVLHYFITRLQSRSLFLAPRIIIHPTQKSLDQREEQFYKELGLASGGREVIVYFGKALQADELEALFSKKDAY